MAYIPPSEVKSPRRHFTLVAVLDDGKTDDAPGGESSVAVAVGRWRNAEGSDEVVLAIRWNGDDANPIGNPQSRGLPTWFILPRHLRRTLLEHTQFSREKTALLREVFGDEFSSGPDGTGWLCDRCGKPIRSAKDGVLEWVDGGIGSWKGRRIFVVHHKLASPLKDKRGRDGCYISQGEQTEAGITTSWGHLDTFLGADGLMQMLAMIGDNEAPAEELLEIIQRLHLPRYEAARPYIKSAIAEGAIEPNLKPGFYWQEDLQTVLHRYGRTQTKRDAVEGIAQE